MIRLIMKEKEISAVEAVAFSINSDIYSEIIGAGWASIALSLWGHDDPEREWLKLDNAIIDINFDQTATSLIQKVKSKEKVDDKTAIAYFLIFTMDSLGYHI